MRFATNCLDPILKGRSPFHGPQPQRKSLVNSRRSQLTQVHLKVNFTFMENPDFDQLLKGCNDAVDHWSMPSTPKNRSRQKVTPW